MKEVVPGQELSELFYRYNFKISNDHTKLTKIRFWLDNNCKGPHGIVKISYWHGEFFGECGDAFDIITIQESHEAVLFKTTWM